MINLKSLLGALLVAFSLVACGGSSGGGSSSNSFDKSAMLDNYATLIGTLADDLKTKSEALKDSFSDYNNTTAKTNWKAMATSWKKIQVILETDKSNNASGNEYYTVKTDCCTPIYTTVDAWRMGQNNANYQEQALDRTEWLLFTPWMVHGETGSSDQNDNNASQISSIGVDESDQLILAATSIKTHWSSAGKLNEIKSVSQESTFYIANRIFEYIGRLKDEHIGRAAGLLVDATTPIPAKVESPSAAYSKEEAMALLEGIKNIYQGGSGLGLDDMLIAAGYSNNNDAVIAAFDDSIAKLNAVDGTLYDAITNDAADVQALFTSLQALEAAYNTNVITLMSVTTDMTFTNDGDSTF